MSIRLLTRVARTKSVFSGSGVSSVVGFLALSSVAAGTTAVNAVGPEDGPKHVTVPATRINRHAACSHILIKVFRVFMIVSNLINLIFHVNCFTNNLLSAVPGTADNDHFCQ